VKSLYLKTCGLAFVVCILAANAAQSGEKLHSVVIENPRDYGYHVGDTIRQTIHIKYAKDMELRMDAAPKQGTVTPWIKLENIERNDSNESQTKYTKLILNYQISGFELEKDTIDTPEFELSVEKGHDKIPVLVHAVSLHISRLSRDFNDITQTEVTLAAPLGPEPISRPLYFYLKWGLFLLGLALLAIAIRKHLLDAKTWSTDHPFSAAIKQIKSINTKNTGSDLQAHRVVHQAFNQQFGRTLFESELDQFFSQYPRFKKEETDIRKFFEESRSLFFSQTATEVSRDGDTDSHIRDLVELAKRCQRAEKGASS